MNLKRIVVNMITPKVLAYLFRYRPVLNWAICSFILALSVSFFETGTLINIDLLIMSFVVMVLIQSMLSHATNDICDEEVDMLADLTGTDRVKVLVDKTATRMDLKLIAVVVSLAVVAFAYYTYTRMGWPILVFAAVGLYAPLAYSVKPLRLGWRPYSELFVVYPVLTTAVVAVAYVATGQILMMAFLIGSIHAVMNIRWFMDGRIMDVEADAAVGKRTTAVKMYESMVPMHQMHDYYNLIVVVTIILAFFVTWAMRGLLGSDIECIPICAIFSQVAYERWVREASPFMDYSVPVSYTHLRAIGMNAVFFNTMILAIIMTVAKVYIL